MNKNWKKISPQTTAFELLHDFQIYQLKNLKKEKVYQLKNPVYINVK